MTALIDTSFRESTYGNLLIRERDRLLALGPSNHGLLRSRVGRLGTVQSQVGGWATHITLPHTTAIVNAYHLSFTLRNTYHLS